MLMSASPIRDQFPGLANNWHYLDTAATAQKPQVVLDAMMRAGGADYATVHRGVYARSANMTVAFEAARERVARFIGAASPNEVVFVRGATEGINLVAQSWGPANLNAGDRIMLSQLAEKVGAHIDVCPLTNDGLIDLDWLEANLTAQHKLVALAHVSNVLGSVLGVKRAAKAAHAVGAKLMLDGCQAAPRMRLNMAELGCDFYVMSGHKLYGPTGVGVLWAKAETLDSMPPWQGGGAMIDRVTFEKTTYAPAPSRFEAGTPMIIEVIGLHAAIDFIDSFGPEAIFAHESALAAQTRDALRGINSVTLYGPEKSAGIVSFSMEGIHPHDIGTILDEENVAIRAGHHCAQPLMDHLGIPATARASFGIYNDENDVAALVRGLERVKRIFG
jgi:cysteine desulfurase/selenocysteine lyase